MNKQLFGRNEQGNEVFLYTIENENVRVSVTDYGAVMVSIVNKKTGQDILLGYDTVEEYITNSGHLGGFIGRTANRIKNAEFELNGQVFHLEKNSGNNNIHGGTDGFDRVMYETEMNETSVVFHRLSPNGEEGYPGDLDVRVTYTLLEDGVEMKAEGTALDQDTIFAMTNHNYYSLDDSETIERHVVRIPAEQYAIDSDDGISQLPLLPVENTAFDFRTPKELGRDLFDSDAQIQDNRGYDHHFAVDGEGLRLFAECTAGDLKLIVESNLPGMHMYTANFLNAKGKGGRDYGPHKAVCFEPEFIPNGINYEGVVKPIVRKGETSVQVIRMRMENL